MLNNRIRTYVCILAWASSGAWMPARAQEQTTSNVDLLAMFGGRITGAARACAINPERVRKAGEKVLLLAKSKAASEAELESVARVFASAQKVGYDDARADKTRCSEVHVDFSEIEVKLAKYPGGDPQVAARRSRPVQPLGALEPGIGGTIEKR